MNFSLFKYHDKVHNLLNGSFSRHALSFKISLLFLIFIFVSISTSYAEFLIEKSEAVLCPDWGNSDPDRILPFNLSLASSPRNESVFWSISPQISGTNFVNGEDIGPGVLIEFSSTPEKYTLTVSEPGGASDSIIIVIGPTARIVSFIEEFNATTEFPEVFAEAFNVLGDEALTLRNRIELGLEQLAIAANNEDPPLSFNSPAPPWEDYVSRKEYRGFLYLQPVAFFDFDTSDLLCSGLIKNEVNHGFTPVRLFGFVGYIPGEPNIPIITPANPSADRTINHNVEIGAEGRFVFHTLFGKVAPFGCHSIRFNLNDIDGPWEVEYSGSDTPSHFVYLNGDRVKAQFETDLAKFLYSDPELGCAPGGVIWPEPCQYDLDESAHFHPISVQVSDSFTVSPDVTCDWKAEVDPLDASWITGVDISNRQGPGTVSYTALENLTASYRTGTIHIKDIVTDEILKSFTIYQAAPCVYTTNPTGASFMASGSGGQVSFSVSVPDGCLWVPVETDDWIINVNATETEGDGIVNYEVTQNLDFSPREGRIDLFNENSDLTATFIISQDGAACTFGISPTSRTHSSDPEVATIQVIPSDEDCPWTVDPSGLSSWIQMNPSSLNGVGTDLVIYSVLLNDTGSFRSDSFSIEGIPFTINQNKEIPEPVIPTDEALFVITDETLDPLRSYALDDEDPPPAVFIRNLDSNPLSISIDPIENTFYVGATDGPDSIIKHFGHCDSEELSTVVSHPVALKFGPLDSLWVANRFDRSIMRINSESGSAFTVIDDLGTPSEPLIDLAFAQNDDLFIAASNADKVVKFESPWDETISAPFTYVAGFLDVKAIEIGPNDDQLYVLHRAGTTNRIHKFSTSESNPPPPPLTPSNGELVFEDITGSFQFERMTIDSNGNLYLADWLSDKIWKLNPGNGDLTEFVVIGERPFAITVGHALNLNNSPPNALNDEMTIFEDMGTLTEFDITANDDDDFSPLKIDSVENPENGMVTLNGDGTIDYSSNSNFSGIDSFSYTITDGCLNDTATVIVTVEPTADPPTTITNPFVASAILEDGGSTLIDSMDFITDPDLPDDFFIFKSLPANSTGGGDIFDNGDGTADYQSAPNFFGTDSFSYTIEDAFGLTAAGTINIPVTPVNDPPSFTAGEDQVVNDDDGPLTISGWATGLSVGPPNEAADGQILTGFLINDVSDPSLFSAQPTIVINGNVGDLVFTPALGMSGVATISISLQDNGGTANGGIDTSPIETFDITVNQSIDPALITHYPFNDATANDAVGLNHGVLIDSPMFTTDTVPGLGEGLLFDGINDEVEVADDPTLNFGDNQSFTVTAWVRDDSPSGTAGWASIVQKSDPSLMWSASHVGYGISKWTTTKNAFSFAISDGTSLKRIGPVQTTEGFHALALVVDRGAGEMRAYLDGELRGELDISTVGSIDTTRALRMGWTGNPWGSPIKGVIDDVKIYSRALHVFAVPDSVSIVEGNSILIDVLDNDTNGDMSDLEAKLMIKTNPTMGNVAMEIDPLDGKKKIRYTSNGSQGVDTFCYEITDSSGAISQALVSVAVVSSVPDIVSHYTFDNATANDSAGSNHGSLVGSPVSTSDTVMGLVRAFSFNGINDYIEVPDHYTLNFDADRSFTLTVWARDDQPSGQGSWGPIVQKSDQYLMWNAAHVGYGISRWGNIKNAFSFAITDGTNWKRIGAVQSTDGFHALALVVDRELGQMRAYVDGVLRGQEDISAVNSIDITKPFRMGNAGHSGSYFNGIIDDVRVYNYALSEMEINDIKDGNM